jgi:inhibitor of KinA
MLANRPLQIYSCGDHALTIVMGDEIAADINELVLGLADYLQQLQIEGVRDVIPAFQTITVVYDLALLKKKYPKESVVERIKNILINSAQSFTTNDRKKGRRVEIPVCYDLSLAPDLEALAGMHGIDIAEVIRLHTATIYRVYMIGFLPGFAYMGTVNPIINTPRKEKPRTRVPKGSVGIAGSQTGIYPFDSPGGWQLIGQTPLPLFDATQSAPCLFKPGDEVIFSAISLAAFNQLTTS